LGVEVPLMLQFSIALFTGMVASTFIPPVRRAIPRPAEIGLWAAFITACVLGVINITDPRARELTWSAVWGIDQLINNLAAGLVGALAGAVSANRVAIAVCIVLLISVDLLALVVLRAHRKTRAWQPRVRLIEWMELPALTPAPPPAQTAPQTLRRVSRRLVALAAVGGAAILASLVRFFIWMRNVVLPREAARLARVGQTGRAESRNRLESLRDTVEQLHFAAGAWYIAAGAPVISGLTLRATEVMRSAQAARRLREAAEATGKVIDIRALQGAQSIGWYGPLTLMQSDPALAEEGEDDAAQRPDSLAS
jgi:hypothetical protein